MQNCDRQEIIQTGKNNEGKYTPQYTPHTPKSQKAITFGEKAPNAPILYFLFVVYLLFAR